MSILKRKKYKDGVDYDKNKDYSVEMNKAKEKGDTALLAQLEEERNRKIEGEGLGYAKTYDYIDIGTKIENGIRDGISADEMNELLFARRDKAIKNEHLNEYKNDEIQKRGLKYYYDMTSGAGVNNENRPEKDTYYEEKISQLFDKIENLKAFEYDIESDDVYKVLKDTLSEQSRRASEDTLSNLSQLGGGASSYAVAAATLTANDYNQKLAEQVPKLYQLALDRYTKANELEFDKLDAAVEIDRNKQNEYVNALNQFNDDRNYALDGVKTYYDMWAKGDEMKDKKDTEEREAALELMKYYQENGIKVPAQILDAAGISGHQQQSDQISEDNRKRIENEFEYDYAKILKASYSSGNKTKTKNEKKTEDKTEDKTTQIAGNDTVLNQKNGKNIIIDGREISEEELSQLLITGQIIIKQTPNGIIYTFAA